MKQIPNTRDGYSLALRTDFSDEAAWEMICAALQQPEPLYNFHAYIEFLSDSQYEALAVKQLFALLPEDTQHTFLFIVDNVALSHPDRPVLVVDLCVEPGRTFRVTPSCVWSVQNNLSIANMDFSEFADNVDVEGIYRRS